MLNEQKELVGTISLDDIRDIIFNTELYDKVQVTELMARPPAIVDRHERIGDFLHFRARHLQNKGREPARRLAADRGKLGKLLDEGLYRFGCIEHVGSVAVLRVRAG